MHSDLITFMLKKIMLEEVGAKRRIGQNMKKARDREGWENENQAPFLSVQLK